MIRLRAGLVRCGVVALALFLGACSDDDEAPPVPPTATATRVLAATATATLVPATNTATAVPVEWRGRIERYLAGRRLRLHPRKTFVAPTATTAITNVRALHTKGSAQYDADCLKCHADVVTEQSLDPQIPGAHAAMLPTFGGAANAACTVCHKAVDFEGQSAANVRRNVDVRGCVNCHSAGGLKYYQPTN